jgi:RNA-directed DNA polymerase
VQKDLGKVHKLQKLLLSSESAKFLATRKAERSSIDSDNFSLTKMFSVSESEKIDVAINLLIDGKITYIKKPTQKLDLLQSFANRAKQELALLALVPQWEAEFEPSNYGFRIGRSIFNAVEAVLSIVSKRQTWVLQVNVSECFTSIDQDLLIKKCNTFFIMERQIKVWLKENILTSNEIQIEGISSFLANVALHGLEDLLSKFTCTFLKIDSYNSEPIRFVGYGCNFLIFHSDRDVLEKVKIILESFLGNLGLDFNLIKMRIIHTYKKEVHPPGFDFLGFNIIHKNRWGYVKNTEKRIFSERKLITLITPSKNEIKIHLRELKKIIQSYEGLSQERLIDLLNPLIENWTLSKREFSTSRLFQKLDVYLYKYLWDWVKKRHPMMSETKLKFNYFHRLGSQSFVFAKKLNVNNKEVYKKLLSHSSIKIETVTEIKNQSLSYVWKNSIRF